MAEKILYKELAYKVVGCFYRVYNELGPGYKESIYHNALALEFRINKIPYYYLRGSSYKLGYLVNFGANKLDIRRRIYDTIRENSRINNSREFA